MRGIVVGARLMAVAAALAFACSVGPRDDNATFQGPPVMTSAGTQGTDSGTTVEIETAGAETTEGEKLDAPPLGGGGCEFVDFLFVIDNSESMATYQMALTEQFPDFIGAMYDALPPSTDVHVGLTTTDFDVGCDDSEATQNCQSTATLDEVNMHYVRPDMLNDGGNGTQGRLFEYAGQTFFETTSDDDPAALTAWFSDAAVAAGEEGCSFEMPVAAAGFAAHPANAVTNQDFIRDESALLVIFFLTDEPDKSPESKDLYGEYVLDAKEDCGGEACVFVSGLIPACTLDVNQKLWQFMGLFSEEDPQWGDIELTGDYSTVFGDALAGAIGEACANVPIP